MSSTIGENIRITIFGQSHSAAVGVTVEGIPAGFRIDTDSLQHFLDRRAPGRGSLSTARREPDRPEFLSGLSGGVTCGAPLTAIIRNTDARPSDYDALVSVPRPGHADWTAQMKYGGFQDKTGGGHFSGRLTAPLCVAGGICLQILKSEGISIYARIKAIGNVTDETCPDPSVLEKSFPACGDGAAAAMISEIEKAKADGDSVGGIIECIAEGIPAGIGDPIFGGMENRIASVVFGIPAVKGIEFGAGFGAAKMRGSENNDPLVPDNGRIVTETNNCGGILGGITDGMPVVFRVAVKPTPSIAKEQLTADLSTGKRTVLSVPGRHDPCIVPRAVPCVEAAAALAVYDAVLSRKKELLT